MTWTLQECKWEETMGTGAYNITKRKLTQSWDIGKEPFFLLSLPPSSSPTNKGMNQCEEAQAHEVGFADLAWKHLPFNNYVLPSPTWAWDPRDLNLHPPYRRGSVFSKSLIPYQISQPTFPHSLPSLRESREKAKLWDRKQSKGKQIMPLA